MHRSLFTLIVALVDTSLAVSSKQILVKDGDACSIYPTEVDRWYDFLQLTYPEIDSYIRWTNALAAKHELSPLKPLAITPMVLRRREAGLDRGAPSAVVSGRCARVKIGHCTVTLSPSTRYLHVHAAPNS